MRRVIPAADVDTPARHDPCDGHEGGVEDGNRQQQHGNDKDGSHATRVRTGFGGERKARQEEAEKETAGVAHEDLRGRKVPHQETGDGADERRADQDTLGIALPDEEQQPERRHHDGDRARQAVHVVEEVKGVGDAHHPEQREEHVGERKAGQPEREAEGEQDAAEQELREQLRRRGQASDVVDETDDRHRAGGEREHHESRRRARHEQRRQQRGDGDGDAAEQRHGLSMPAVGGRPRDDAEPARERPTDVREHKTQSK